MANAPLFTQLPLQQHKGWLDKYCKNPAYWKLIEENPKDFISRDAVRDLGPLKITTDSGDTTFRTAVILNHLKMLHWILLPQHLGRRLNDEGEYGGKSYEMWIYAAMIAVRAKAKLKRVIAKPKKGDRVLDMQDMTLQLSQVPPHMKLQPIKKLVTKSEAEKMQAAAGNMEAAIDEIPLVQPDMFANLEEKDLEPETIAQFSDEDFIRNIDEFNAWFVKNNMQMDAPMFDQELRNVRQRPQLSRAQVDRVIQQAMLHVEVVADGTHERLAKHSAELKHVSCPTLMSTLPWSGLIITTPLGLCMKILTSGHSNLARSLLARLTRQPPQISRLQMIQQKRKMMHVRRNARKHTAPLGFSSPC